MHDGHARDLEALRLGALDGLLDEDEALDEGLVPVAVPRRFARCVCKAVVVQALVRRHHVMSALQVCAGEAVWIEDDDLVVGCLEVKCRTF